MMNDSERMKYMFWSYVAFWIQTGVTNISIFALSCEYFDWDMKEFAFFAIAIGVLLMISLPFCGLLDSCMGRERFMR